MLSDPRRLPAADRPRWRSPCISSWAWMMSGSLIPVIAPGRPGQIGVECGQGTSGLRQSVIGCRSACGWTFAAHSRVSRRCRACFLMKERVVLAFVRVRLAQVEDDRREAAERCGNCAEHGASLASPRILAAVRQAPDRSLPGSSRHHIDLRCILESTRPPPVRDAEAGSQVSAAAARIVPRPATTRPLARAAVPHPGCRPIAVPARPSATALRKAASPSLQRVG